MGRKKRGSKGNWPARGASPSRAPSVPVAGSGSGSGSRIEFVMRVERFGDSDCYHNKIRHYRNEFYMVYLENDEFIAKPLCESQFNTLALGPSFMHRCGSRIYNISWCPMADVNLIPDSLPSQGEEINCHKGISWFDFNDGRSRKKWHSGPSLDWRKLSIVSAVFGKEIYCMQSSLVEKHKVYNTVDGSFEHYKHELPKEFSKCIVNGKIIPQPRKNRLLVLLTDNDYASPNLYSWNPRTNVWYSITTDIDSYKWTYGLPILVEGVLYFYTGNYPTYFSAYDLGCKKWVKVKWSTRFPPDAARVNADNMLYLGNGLVCLPTCRPIPTDDTYDQLWGVCIYFRVFHFCRTSALIDGPVITFSHRFTKTIDMEDVADIADFLTPFWVRTGKVSNVSLNHQSENLRSSFLSQVTYNIWRQSADDD